MNIIKIINKTFMIMTLSLLLATVTQANATPDAHSDEESSNIIGPWSCSMEEAVLAGGSVGLVLNLTSYEGEATITCRSPFNKTVTREVMLSYEAIGVGLGVSFPKDIYAVSLSNGFKVDHPDNLYGEFQLGVGGSATVLAVQFGMAISIVDPSKGLVLNLQLHVGSAFGLHFAPVNFQTLKIQPLN